MAQAIAFMNGKGGAAKSTNSVNVADCLAAGGDRVLLADCDDKGQVSAFIWWSNKTDGKQRFDCMTFGVSDIPKMLADYENDYDWIIIDTPPCDSDDTIQILSSVDMAILTTSPSPIELNGSENLVQVITDFNDLCGTTIARILLNRCEKGTLLTMDALRKLKEWDIERMESGTTYLQAYQNGFPHGETVFTTRADLKKSNQSEAVKQIQAITAEIKALVGNPNLQIEA